MMKSDWKLVTGFLQKLFLVDSVITFFMLDSQGRETARRFDLDLDLVPLTVAFHISRGIADAVLVTQFEGDARRRVFKFSR